MIPSFRWFPYGLQERAAWYQNFSTQFSAVGVSLGFTPSELTEVDEDNQVMQFLANTVVQLDAYKDAVGKYREIITEHAIGQPTPAFPANPSFNLPIIQPTGIFQRLVELVDRIKSAPAYTDEIGALLGIIPKTPDSISPEDVKPKIEAFAAQSGYMFSVVVANRGKANMWEVQIRRAGQEKWQTVKTASGKSVDVEVQPTEDGKPEQVQVRVQLLKDNQPYGMLSDMVSVTVVE
jgi:hypothetical protein